jgi:hypothetical protein
LFNGGLDEQSVLFEVDSGRLASRADDDNAARPLYDVPVDQTPKGIEVEAAILEHRRDNRY